MANILEYTLSLQDELSTKLNKIGVNSEEALDVFSKLESQTRKVQNAMGSMGVSIGTLSQQVALLKAEKEWIPASNKKDLKIINGEIAKLERQINRLNNIESTGIRNWFSSLKQQIPILNMLRNPLVLLAIGVRQLNSYLKQSTGAYKEQAVAETKLAAIMRNTMNATEGDVKAILSLASAQQKLGVIGGEVQLAGAQELATYVTKRESLERLLPAMNDMLAQQYGLNATQEQAVTIASMMGKVLDGQVGALSRYGYRFDEAQENVLKYGTEAQRTAMLAQVLQQYVGGVNKALAATPEGQLKQAANNTGNLNERVGQLYMHIQATLLPVREKIQEIIESIIVFFEQNAEKIKEIVGAIASAIVFAISVITPPLEWMINLIVMVTGWLYNFMQALQEGNVYAELFAIALMSLASGLAANFLWVNRLVIASKIKALWDTILTIKTLLFTKAIWALNIAMKSNPIGWIVAGVMALVSAIVLVIKKLGIFK
jgi:polyhydroxyalkanoate synthesis regulator phasin